jgi:hypothetical protein
MSSYADFIVEVRLKGSWNRLYWKSYLKDYSYREFMSDKPKETSVEVADGVILNVAEDERLHKHAMTGQFYEIRDMIKNDELGSTRLEEDFTAETKAEIERSKDGYGWYEGYFYLKELASLLEKKDAEYKEFLKNGMIRRMCRQTEAIYKHVCLGDTQARVSEEDEEEFSEESFEMDCEWRESEISTLRFVDDFISGIVDEIVGYLDGNDIRVILIAG